jgi:NTP pyrophosphatase (non-canonical NTP hydrolase)
MGNAERQAQSARVGINAYLNWSRKTWQKTGDIDMDVAHGAMGLAGESGEVLDLVKKQLFTPFRFEQKGQDFLEEMFDELGDVLYYWVRLCDELGFEPEEVIAANIAKLESRYKEISHD